MRPKKLAEGEEAPKPEFDALPTDAAKSLEELIDLRFRDLLSLASDSAALTGALKAATEWIRVKRTGEEDKEYGSAYRRGVN